MPDAGASTAGAEQPQGRTDEVEWGVMVWPDDPVLRRVDVYPNRATAEKLLAQTYGSNAVLVQRAWVPAPENTEHQHDADTDCTDDCPAQYRNGRSLGASQPTTTGDAT